MSADANVWSVVEAVLPHAKRCMLYGPPGTGKTYSALHIAAKGQPTFSVTVTEDMSAAALCGHYMPAVDAASGNAVFRWHDGPGSLGWKQGGVIVLNEINLAGGDLAAYLLNLCDDTESAVLTLASGETIRPAAATRIVATMNGDPSDLSEALASRFPVGFYIDRPHPAAIERLPADLRTAAANSTSAVETDRRINLRTWYAFADLRTKVPVEAAAVACFGNRATEVLTGLKVGGA